MKFEEYLLYNKMLPLHLHKKVMAYRPVARSIFEELNWFFILRRFGYSRREAQKEAMYHFSPNDDWNWESEESESEVEDDFEERGGYTSSDDGSR
jgi:hypothetical protein